MRIRTVVVLALMVLWSTGSSFAQDGLIKEDRQGPVTVTVALTAPPVDLTPIRVQVSLDTHSVMLDAIEFENAVAMRNPEGIDIRPSATVQVKGGGHHREAVLVFPPIAHGGSLRIVVKNVGGVPERLFIWGCPTIC
jgi:hypothetical protein